VGTFEGTFSCSDCADGDVSVEVTDGKFDVEVMSQDDL